jgi:queuine tRNA-ribosyltransferase
MSGFEFRVVRPDAQTKARAGAMTTRHGTVATPIFMPVGTQGTVKALTTRQIRNDVQAQIILGNTYHLYLRPGLDVLAAAGGLHGFMNWHHPILTDSGGYQVYSLAAQRKIKPDGVEFRSHIDGSRHFFTPTNVVDKQFAIGSDIQMVLDECPPYPCERSYAEKSLKLTHAWAEQARSHYQTRRHERPLGYAQFGITQGSVYPDLRAASCARIEDLDFEGNAIGGLAVGEPDEQMYELIDHSTSLLPVHKPRYVMGIGTPLNILNAIALGVDMMDCVLPSRNARHGLLYFMDGIRNLKNARYRNDHRPLDPDSELDIDREVSFAYLRHLFAAEEYLALTLATLHNLHFFVRLTQLARQHIIDGTFQPWKQHLESTLGQRI